MAVPVIIPELQFVDADGHPYAGGTLSTFVTGTSTPKATWVDPDGLGLNQNPIVLDAAGRCLCWGDGGYRLVLRDASGNLVWDQPATTIVSAAMEPVVSAPTIADAVELFGINDDINGAVAAEAALRAAADSAETARAQTVESNLLTDIQQETLRAQDVEATLLLDIQNETNRALAAEAALATGASGGASIRAGSLSTDISGNFSVTFSPAFATKCALFTVVDPNASTNTDGTLHIWMSVLGFPGITGPGALSRTAVSGEIVTNAPSGQAQASNVTLDYMAWGY